MNQTPSSPARKQTRFRCNQKLCVRYRIDGQDFIAYGRCTTVSKSGIGAHLPVELPLEQVATLEISLTAGGIPRQVKGKVVNRRGSSYGFEFLEVNDRAVIGLRTLLQSQTAVAR